MAGDWIKMRTDLQTHPKVVRIVSALNADKLRVIGGLHAVWSVFDAHSADGNLDGYTLKAMDDHLGWPGFSAAMVSVGWLIEHAQCLATPRFSEHNGQSAKRRAQETQRKREERKLSASDADKKRTREEKRREEEIPPNPPTGGEVGAVGQSPTKAGEVCRAIKSKGVVGVNPSNPELKALIDQGVPVETFEAAAEICAKATPPKGMAYLLGIVKRQLGEAAAIASGAAMPEKPWDESRSSILAKAAQLGMAPWNEHDLSADRETFQAYTARVRRAVEQPEPA